MIRFVLLLFCTFSILTINSQDICSTANDEGELTCGSTISGSGDSSSTPDPAESINCMVGLDGTWFSFTTDPSVPEFTISGTDYNLFEGDCSGLNAVADCGNGLTVFADASTTYYVLVFDNFTIDAPSEPSNDNCGNATEAVGGVTGETNECATTDDGICGSDGNASVWYSYTLDQDVSMFQIALTSQGIIDPVLALYSDCATQIVEECGAELIVSCLSAGNYMLQVASDFENVGEFDLTFTETPTTVSNDNCENAIDVTPSASCTAENVSGDSSDSCPELSGFGTGCEVDMFPTVWFEVTTSGEATSLDFENLSSNLELAIIDGCGGAAVTGCISGDINLPVNGNTTYLIAATLTTGEGSFDFDITMNEPPVNDLCSDATDINSGEGFNTCCGAIEGTDGCGGSETGVWIEYSNADGDGTTFTFTNIDMSGNIGIEIYAGGCGGELLNEPYCGGAGSYEFTVANCLETTFLVHVTSSEDGCGSFDLTAAFELSCSFGEDCGSGPALAPTTGAGEECAAGCTTFSCDSDCGSGGGVWFEVTTDEEATEMTVVVNDVGGGNIDPVVTILQNDCSGGALVSCSNVASGDIIETAVSGNITYFIEVSTGSGGTPGDFELCVTTDLSVQDCSAGDMEPTRPEYPDEDPEGPYCPGEIVNFCYSVTFTVDPIGQGNNCQWIQGIIPTIGGGWDLDAMPLDIQGPGGSWFWLDEESVQYNASTSILGIIDTPNGLGLEYGPGTLSEGDLLPGGWWATSDGGGCANNGNPNTMWGLPASCGSTQDVEFCFDLQVGLLDDIGQCSDPDFTDLKVHIFTMADGQTGCWSNNSCIGDAPVTFNAILDCTSLVFILGEDEEICSDDFVDIFLESEDGSNVNIIVEVVDEGNTSGAMDHEFTGGMGTIADRIENEGSDIEIVVYEAYALDPNSICEGPRTTIEVTVYPEIVIDAEDPYYICYQSPIEIAPIVYSGDGGPYQYLWEDGSTNESIELPLDPDLLPGEYEIILMVTDDTGCSKEEIIKYEIVEPVSPTIENPLTGVCKDGILDFPQLYLDFESVGTGPYEFVWESNPGGLQFESNNDEQILVINEEESSARTYTIFGTVIDEYGCEYTAETELIVDNGPDMILEIDECFGTAFQLVGYDSDGQLVTFELFYDEDSDWIYDGVTILNAESVAQNYGDNISYLAEEYGTYLLLGTSENGCNDYVELELPPVPQPEFEILPNDTICQGTPVSITIVNSNEYVDIEWSNGESGPTINVMPTDTIVYYVVAETNADCVVTDSIRVVVNPQPIVSITGSTSICPGSQTLLTAEGDANNIYSWTSPTNQVITDQTAIITEIGDWLLNVSTPAGCVASETITIDENAQLNPTISGGNICTGTAITLNGGPGFDSYEWLDESGDIIGNNQTLEITQGGDYTLNVVLGTGTSDCVGTDVFNVEQFDPVPDALTQNSASVCNVNTGSLQTNLDLTSFETGVMGDWFDNNNLIVSDPTNVDFNGNAPGVYNYTFITNEAQLPCEDETYNFAIDVSDCACPSVAIGTPPNFCNELSTFNLNLIQITSELGSWSIEPNSIDISGGMLMVNESTPSGIYNLTFTLDDINQPVSCNIDSTVQFEVFTSLSAQLESEPTVCNEDTGNGPDFIDLDDLFLSGDLGEWSTNNTNLTIDSENIVSFTGVEVGDYRFFYFIEDLNSPCDPISIPVDIEVRDCSCPELDLMMLPNLCNTGGNFDLNDFLVNPENQSGVWSIMGPDGTALVGSSVFSDGRTAGQYEFTFTFNNVFGGSCTNSVTGFLDIFDPPFAEVLDGVAACNGTTLTVLPTELNFNDFVNGDQGIWTAPQNYNGGLIGDVSSVDFLDVDPGIYTFVYTTSSANEPCEEVEYNLNVEVRNCNCPSVAFIPPTSLCNDGPPIDLNAYLPSDAPEGFWSFINGDPEVEILNGSFVNLIDLNGFYLFQYTLNEVPLGCPDFGQISIEVVMPPEVTHIPEIDVCNTVSINGPLCLNLNDFLIGTPGQWVVPDNFDGDDSDLNNICFESEGIGESLEFTFNTETGTGTCDERSYTTIVTIKDCNCPNLSVVSGPELCSLNTNFNLSDLETDNMEPGSWAFFDGPQSLTVVNGNIELTNISAGVYTFRYMPSITPSSDCDQFGETSITIVAYPSVGELSVTDLCVGDGEIVELADLLINAEAGGTWSALQPTQGFDFVNNTFTANGAEPGIFEFEYAFSNILPCPDNAIVATVIVSPLLVPEIEDSPCANANEGTIIIPSVPTTQGNYLYSLDGGQNWEENPIFENLAPGAYTLMIQDENGCQTSLPNIIVSEPGPFSIDAGEDRNVDAGNDLITLQLATAIPLEEIESIVWTENGEIECSGNVDQCLIIEVNPDGVAEYCATVTDINGCVSDDCVILRERVVKDVYIANVFDLSSIDNNKFFIQTDEFVESIVDFKIYDRWGELVFNADPNHLPNIPEKGWDGTFNGKFALQGVYVYVVNVKFTDGTEELYAGDITLLR